MALDPTLVTAGIALFSGLVGAAFPVLTARITAKPSAQDALNASFVALSAQQKLMADTLAQERDKFQILVSTLEIRVIKLNRYIDTICDRLEQRGIDYPERPLFNGEGKL